MQRCVGPTVYGLDKLNFTLVAKMRLRCTLILFLWIGYDPCCFPDLIWLAYRRCLDAVGFEMPIFISGVPFMLIIPAGWPLTKWYGFLGSCRFC